MWKFSHFRRKNMPERQTHPERFQTFAELWSKAGNTPGGAQSAESGQRHRSTPEKTHYKLPGEVYEQKNDRTGYDHNPFLWNKIVTKSMRTAREARKFGDFPPKCLLLKKWNYHTEVCGKIGEIYTRHPLAVYSIITNSKFINSQIYNWLNKFAICYNGIRCKWMTCENFTNFAADVRVITSIL